MRPELETLYPRHEVFLALLHRADTSGEQTTSTHEIDAVCTMMRRQFGDDLVLCADGATLVAALGPTGDELVRTGRVPIAAIAAQFTLAPQERMSGGTPSLFGMLHRLNRHRQYLQAFSATPH